MSANLRYAPEFQVIINGEPVSAALRASISSISMQSGLEGADRIEVYLVNENLRWLDHPSLRLDCQITVRLGYAPEPLAQMFVGKIVGHNASFPSNGLPLLTVIAQDGRSRMQRGNKVRAFAVSVPNYGNLPIPDPVVASAISATHGLIPIIDPVGAVIAILIGGAQTVASLGDPDAMQRVIRKQNGESDYDFLKRISAENGWEMLIDHSGPMGGLQLRFISPFDHLAPDVTLRYGHDLIEFTPRITNVGQIAGVSATVWQPDIKTEFSVRVGWDWDRQSLEISISPGFGIPMAENNGEPEFELVDRQVTVASAPGIILGKLLPRLNRRLTGSGSTIGDPRIKAGGVIRLEGIGESFGGLYRITSVSNTVDGGGWITSFELRKEIWFGSIPLPEQGAVPIRVTG